MKLTKRQLCLEKNYQTGKFEETTLFVVGRRIYIYIYIYIYIRRGPQLKKRPAKKEEEKDENREGKKRLFIHI